MSEREDAGCFHGIYDTVAGAVEGVYDTVSGWFGDDSTEATETTG